jgi:hypothetical protein
MESEGATHPVVTDSAMNKPKPNFLYLIINGLLVEFSKAEARYAYREIKQFLNEGDIE